MPPLPVMLAGRPDKDAAANPRELITRLMEAGDRLFEIKYDGIRAQVTVNGGEVSITNREHRDITHRYPDVVEAMSRFPVDAVFDGEIACLDSTGRPVFEWAHRRDAQVDPVKAAGLVGRFPATFVAFDVLEALGQGLTRRPYHSRRAVLEQLGGEFQGRAVVAVSSPDGHAMWDVVRDRGLEGLIAKRVDSLYVPKRVQSWLKIKRALTVHALVAGYEPGTGSRAATFGALHLALLSDLGGEAVHIGKVGSGFTDWHIAEIWERLNPYSTPMVARVSFLEIGDSGTLRFPVFKQLRDDIDPVTCTMRQLRMAATLAS